jgi:hypothetical protein
MMLVLAIVKGGIMKRFLVTSLLAVVLMLALVGTASAHSWKLVDSNYDWHGNQYQSVNYFQSQRTFDVVVFTKRGAIVKVDGVLIPYRGTVWSPTLKTNLRRYSAIVVRTKKWLDTSIETPGFWSLKTYVLVR